MNLITKEDLLKVKQEIITETIEELKKLLQGQTDPEYIKSKDVKRILGCSDSKLGALRKTEKLPWYKLQGTLYFKTEDVYKLMQASTE